MVLIFSWEIRLRLIGTRLIHTNKVRATFDCSLVTKTESQMDGIRSNIQMYNDAVQHYNEDAECLVTDCEIDMHSKMRKGHNVIYSVFLNL